MFYLCVPSKLISTEDDITELWLYGCNNCHANKAELKCVVMLANEEQWSRALAHNNVRHILRWLHSLLAEGDDAEVNAGLARFRGWVQKMSELSKKELLNLCFSRCQGLWMFLDQSSFTRVHLLLQKLTNLLTLVQWGRRQPRLAHLWHGLGVLCVECKGACGSSAERGCWSQEHKTLKQHIWLGKLVQWWGITGLLPRYPEAQEMKRISQMWREMDHSQRRACQNTPEWEEGGRERWNSLIQGMVAQMDKQLGPIWTSEDCSDQVYPPPSLQALLKLVLLPRIDTVSIQAILMYFVLDMASFLQCKDDLLQSFCNAFTIRPSFCQQIRAFWLLDHGHMSSSMELLLSPRCAAPWLSWQHRCILRSLLRGRQTSMALRYLLWTRPAVEGTQDLKLCVDVLLQNGHVSGAWALLRTGNKGRRDTVRYILQQCDRLGLHPEPSNCQGILESDERRGEEDEAEREEGAPLPAGGEKTHLPAKWTGQPLSPFSAQLYQSQSLNKLCSDDLVRLFREAVSVLKPPRPRAREVVSLCEAPERRQSCPSLSTQALRQLLPHPSPGERQPCIANLEEHSPSLTEDVPAAVDDPASPPASLPAFLHTSPPASPIAFLLASPSTSPLTSPPTSIPASPPAFLPASPPSSASPAASPPASLDSPESASSFASASSLFHLRWAPPSVSESSVTLQQISALLDREAGGDCCSPQLQKESKSSSAETPPGCPDLALTLEGAGDPFSFNSLGRDGVEELVSSDWAVEEVLTCFSQGEEVLMEAAGASGDPGHLLHRRPRSRLNLPPQFYSNEDNQSVPSTLECDMESHNLLTPDYDKLGYHKGVSRDVSHGPPNATEGFSIPASKSQPASLLSQTYRAASQCFLELEPLQRASELPLLEDAVECFRRDSQDAVDQPEILTSCALTEVTQDQLSELQHSLGLLEASQDSPALGSGPEGKQESWGPGSYRQPFSLKDSSLHIPLCRSRKLQAPAGPLSPRTSPTRSPQLSPAGTEGNSLERSVAGAKSSRKESACFRSTSDRLGHCKLGSWWKQALETRRASTGLLPAMEQLPTITLEKRASLVPGRMYSHTLVTCSESSSKQKGDKRDVKQAEKEEPGAHRASGKAAQQRAEQGVAGQRGPRPRRGKRVKKA